MLEGGKEKGEGGEFKMRKTEKRFLQGEGSINRMGKEGKRKEGKAERR